MTNQHPITPPPELVEQWTSLANEEEGQEVWSSIAAQAAQWGADQQLEACCEWFHRFYRIETWMKKDLAKLRNACRPEPPSLKEQALDALRDLDQRYPSSHQAIIIRKALEEL